ncbi:unnamed protein product [Discosporangium mesarthrocarpum]
MTTKVVESNGESSLSDPDMAVVGLAVTYHTVVFLTVLHMNIYRTWPPYDIRNVCLVNFTALAGALCSLGASIRYGFWQTNGIDGVFLDAESETFVIWLGVGMLVNTVFLRVYRSAIILLVHQANMWPVTMQMFLLQVPFLAPNIAWAYMPESYPG